MVTDVDPVRDGDAEQRAGDGGPDGDGGVPRRLRVRQQHERHALYVRRRSHVHARRDAAVSRYSDVIDANKSE